MHFFLFVVLTNFAFCAVLYYVHSSILTMFFWRNVFLDILAIHYFVNLLKKNSNAAVGIIWRFVTLAIWMDMCGILQSFGEKKISC